MILATEALKRLQGDELLVVGAEYFFKTGGVDFLKACRCLQNNTVHQSIH